MDTCRHQKDLERWFDGESPDSESVESHLAACPACTAQLDGLRRARAAVTTLAEAPEIPDAQFPAFLASLHEQLARPKPRHRGRWALASAVAAALIVAVCVLVVFTPQPSPVAATIVESYTTEIDGATTTSYYSENGTATVWINVPEGDMW